MEAIFFSNFIPSGEQKERKKIIIIIISIITTIFSLYTCIISVQFFGITRKNEHRRGKKPKERKESFRFIYPYRYSIYRPLATNNPSPLLFLARRLTFPSVTPNSRQFSLLTETWKRSIESESYAYSHFPFPSPRTRNLRGDLRIRNLVINKTTLFFARIFNYQLFKRIFFSLDRVTNSQMINSLIY